MGNEKSGADNAAAASPAKPAGKLATLLIVAAAAVLACVAVIRFVVLPELDANRENARIDACATNLRQIGKALRAYQERWGRLPPACETDEKGKPKHSWRVLILPFMESEEVRALYYQYNFEEPWNGPHNRTLAKKMPPVFRCPSDTDDEEDSGGGETSYVAVLGPGTVFDGVRATNFPGGPGEAIVVVEAARSGINWLDPRDLDLQDMPRQVNAAADKGIRSRHSGGANELFGDGQARFLPDALPPEQLEALLSISGGKALLLDGEELLR
jgi:prepilin-type processing-associated H-X9-DG protein